MKKFLLICMFIYGMNLYSQPSVHFFLPSDNNNLSNRVYDYFSHFYGGKVTSEDYYNVNSIDNSNHKYYVILQETNNNGFMSFQMRAKFDYSSISNSFGSNTVDYSIVPKAFEIAFELMLELEPAKAEYWQDTFETLFEECEDINQ